MTSTTTTGTKEVTIDNVPERGIIMYYGVITQIPAGWALCDGDNETPDLSDRFIIGATKKSNIKDKAQGSADKLPNYTADGSSLSTTSAGNHAHDAATWCATHGTSGSHDMIYSGFVGSNLPSGKTKRLTDWTGDHTHPISGTITSSPSSDKVYEGKPQWYALAFIMKLPTL